MYGQLFKSVYVCMRSHKSKTLTDVFKLILVRALNCIPFFFLIIKQISAYIYKLIACQFIKLKIKLKKKEKKSNNKRKPNKYFNE